MSAACQEKMCMEKTLNKINICRCTLQTGTKKLKREYQENIFLISPQKHMLWYSLEVELGITRKSVS